MHARQVDPRSVCTFNMENFYPLKTGSCFVVQAGPESLILLPRPPKCWDYRYIPPYSASNGFYLAKTYCSDFIVVQFLHASVELMSF
jgi:hypothetical protein